MIFFSLESKWHSRFWPLSPCGVQVLVKVATGHTPAAIGDTRAYQRQQLIGRVTAISGRFLTAARWENEKAMTTTTTHLVSGWQFVADMAGEKSIEELPAYRRRRRWRPRWQQDGEGDINRCLDLPANWLMGMCGFFY